VQRGRDRYGCKIYNRFPNLPQDFLWQDLLNQFLLQALRQFLSSVFHILFQKGVFAIGVGLMVWSPRNYIGAGICGRAMRSRDLWSSFYSMREET